MKILAGSLTSLVAASLLVAGIAPAPESRAAEPELPDHLIGGHDGRVPHRARMTPAPSAFRAGSHGPPHRRRSRPQRPASTQAVAIASDGTRGPRAGATGTKRDVVPGVLDSPESLKGGP